jgi:hypothetical protein
MSNNPFSDERNLLREEEVDPSEASRSIINVSPPTSPSPTFRGHVYNRMGSQEQIPGSHPRSISHGPFDFEDAGGLGGEEGSIPHITTEAYGALSPPLHSNPFTSNFDHPTDFGEASRSRGSVPWQRHESTSSADEMIAHDGLKKGKGKNSSFTEDLEVEEGEIMDGARALSIGNDDTMR